MTATAPTYQPLTLSQKQELRGRWLTQYDPETGFYYCVDCLSDLPHDHLWHDHVCTNTPVCLDGSDVVEELPEPVVHKTRTVEVGTEALTGHVDWYGQPIVIYGHVSKAFCTCGWKSGWCDDRPQARLAARYHREHPEADAA